MRAKGHSSRNRNMELLPLYFLAGISDQSQDASRGGWAWRITAACLFLEDNFGGSKSFGLCPLGPLGTVTQRAAKLRLWARFSSGPGLRALELLVLGDRKAALQQLKAPSTLFST